MRVQINFLRSLLSAGAVLLAFASQSVGAPPTENQGAGNGEKVKLLIQFANPPGQAEVAAVAKHGGVVTRRFQIIPSVAATVPRAALPALLAEPGVQLVEVDSEVVAHEYGGNPGDWGVARIGSASVHTGAFATDGVPVLGTGVKVAVIDTGIDYNHSQLARVYAGGYDFVNNDANPMDDQYHGTHCAGTIAAALDGTGVVGVAPDVQLYGLKVLSSTGSGSWSYVISALDWCVQNQIQVASMSLGGGYVSQVETACRNAEAAGVVLVASAGNSGAGTDTVGYPAALSTVIAVASTTISDTRSSFSSTGPSVEIAAPGSDILSTYPSERYAYLSGTSMACPHVSGVAALLIAAGITDSNNNGRINDDVRLVLQMTAEDFGATGRDQEFGFGLVDAETAVAMVFDPNGGGGGGGDPTPVFNAPTNLVASSVLSTVSLQWDDNSNVEEEFEIQYGLKNKGRITWNSSTISVPADTVSTTITLPGGTYVLRVRAVKDGGNNVTGWSNQAQVSVSTGSGGGGKGGGKK